MTPEQLAAFSDWYENYHGETTMSVVARDAFAAGWEARGEEMVPRGMETAPESGRFLARNRDGWDVVTPEELPFDAFTAWLPLPAEPQEVPK